MTVVELATLVGAPLLPPGVRHYQTSGFARTRLAYDALLPEDGWEEHRKQESRWKVLTVPEGRITVFSPLGEDE